MSVVGNRIHEARRVRKMTQGELARRVGVSQGHVSNVERGVTVDVETIGKIAAVLDLDMKQLMLEFLGVFTELESKIMADPALRNEERELLVEIYRVFRKRGPLGQAA